MRSARALRQLCTVMEQPYAEIGALELARELRAGAADIVVVDVRDMDRAGGHVRGSINILADDFVRNAARHAARFAPGARVVFHCMYSQQRGPMCARALAEANKTLSDELPHPKPYVLVGGFRGLAASAQFHDLLEGYSDTKGAKK